MTTFAFTKAVKQQEKLRLALDGPAGSGKTWTALIIATDIAQREDGRVAVIDSERSSARKYASDFDFDHLTLPDWSPHTYMGAVRSAEDQGYAVIVIDSFSHAWEGVLELKDNATARSRSKNSYTEGWREATPVHNELVDTVLRVDAHVIATLRTKTEYVIEDGGKVTKVGLKPIQREGVDFEFDVVGDMTAENSMVISKTRCSALAGQVIRKPDDRLAVTLWNWLNDGEPTISESDAQRLAEMLNTKGKPAREAWLHRFGCKPTALPASRLVEAQEFVAGLQDWPDGEGPGDAVDREATDEIPSDTPSDAGSIVDTPPGPAPTSGNGANRRGVTVRDVARRATDTFKADYDTAERGTKTRVVDRLRHALIHAETGSRTASLNDLDPEELSAVYRRLDDIANNRLGYTHNQADDAGVTFTTQTGVETTILWADLEDHGVDPQSVPGRPEGDNQQENP